VAVGTAGVLAGKVALITGAGRGIGRGIAHAFVKEGAKIAIAEIDDPAADGVVAELEAIGGEALAIHCDIRDSSQVNACVATTVERFGGLDILVNNAIKADVYVPLEEIDDSSIDLALDTGPKATLYFMRASFPYLSDGGGRVINFRSSSEIQGLPQFSTYVASKAAIAGITKVAAREWGRKGINVNAICPFVLSDAAMAFFETQPGYLDKVYDGLAIPRSGDPETDIGRAAVFLAGPDSSFLTGATLMMDGGGAFIG
jgi:NAD(P)-dependent dehydrogenase (short-subunit alcohol dehydrogenase family)